MAQDIKSDKKNILTIEIPMQSNEFPNKAKLFNNRAYRLSRYGLNMFALIRFASIEGDEKLKSPADVQDFMFAIEAACEIGHAVILQSWEDSDKVLKIAEIKLEEINDDRENYFLSKLDGLHKEIKEQVLKELELVKESNDKEFEN